MSSGTSGCSISTVDWAAATVSTDGVRNDRPAWVASGTTATSSMVLKSKLTIRAESEVRVEAISVPFAGAGRDKWISQDLSFHFVDTSHVHNLSTYFYGLRQHGWATSRCATIHEGTRLEQDSAAWIS